MHGLPLTAHSHTIRHSLGYPFMMPVTSRAELSLDDPSSSAEATLVLEYLALQGEDSYTPEAEFDPDFPAQVSTHIFPARAVCAATLASREILPTPRSRAEALDSVRQTLGNLAVEMRSASAMPEREAPITLSCGVAALDAITGGLPRGALTEIYGPVSSGRTSLLLAALAAATARGETCALIDVTDNFSPHSAAQAGVELSRLLWVRCNGAQPARESNAPRFASNDFGGHDLVAKPRYLPSAEKLARSADFRRLEQALQITDLLIQAGGFGLIVLDTSGLPPDVARRVPLASWFRFRRAVEHSPTVLLAVQQEAFAQSCASLVLRTERMRIQNTHTDAVEPPDAVEQDEVPRAPTFAALLHALQIAVEVERAPQIFSASHHARKKPPRSVRTEFTSAACWG